MADGRPRGVPIQVAARVNTDGRDTRNSDISVSGRKVVITPGAAFSELSMQDFDLDDAYGPEQTEGDMFERTLQPLVRAFLEGVCASVVVIGGADSGKTRMLEMLVPMTMENMFMQLQEKQKKAAGGRRGCD